MTPRNDHGYIILLAIVVVAGILVAMLARLAILAKGADVGTANLVFLIVLGICAIFYLVVMAISSGVTDIFSRKQAFGRRRRESADVNVMPNEPNITEINRIKQEVVPWLKSVFVPLAELEDSYIKGKLYDGHTKRYIIPNIEDLEAYMLEQKG